jgi:hypothetical protein
MSDTDLLDPLAVRIRSLKNSLAKLQRENKLLREQVAVLKDEAAVRESFVKDVMEQKRCPECERERNQWYST